MICLIYYIVVKYNALARLPAAVSGNEHEGKKNTDQACVAGKYCLQNFLKRILFLWILIVRNKIMRLQNR